MENEILVKYEENSNWTKLNADPKDGKMAISTLYAVAPFKIAKVQIGWLPPAYYRYENGIINMCVECDELMLAEINE